MKIAIFYLIGGIMMLVVGWVLGHSAGVNAPPTQDEADTAFVQRLADRDKVLVRIKQLSREWKLTEFPDEATAHTMQLDLLAALVGGGQGPSDEIKELQTR